MTYECVKSARLSNGMLSGQGYALAPFEELAGGVLDFAMPLHGTETLSFVFGFQGVGHHYRCDIIPRRSLVILHLLKDGIPVYLQHASMKLAEGMDFHILWSKHSLRLCSGNMCFINILGEGIDSGRWGFVVNGNPISLPDVTTTRKPSFQPQWVILGDGYSNNRWPNRHFFSWPELAFGNKGDYLNACVAAGNTRRVLEVIEQIPDIFNGAKVILAAGADDFIEGVPTDESLCRIRQILSRFRELEAGRIHVCSIPPRAHRDEEVIKRNAELASIAKQEADGFIDLHGMLLTKKEELLVNGDYPGAKAQLAIAREISLYFNLEGELAPLVNADRSPQIRGFASRVARGLLNRLETGLDRFPTVSVS